MLIQDLPENTRCGECGKIMSCCGVEVCAKCGGYPSWVLMCCRACKKGAQHKIRSKTR